MVLFVFCLLVYFLPSIIAHQKQSFTGIFVLNRLLGWTVIGWIAALSWACVEEARVPMVAVNGPSHYCCRCGAMAPAPAQHCWACGARM